MGTTQRKAAARAAWTGPLAAGTAPGGAAITQPNELDARRIERALKRRLRYRYVQPLVVGEPGGYRVLSPCCSRRVDAVGGTIDIARLQYDARRNNWQLYAKDHLRDRWLLQTQGRLHELLELLNADPGRVFWQ
jgi:hypothetical protein